MSDHECPPGGPAQVGDTFHCGEHNTDWEVTAVIEMDGEVLPIWTMLK